MIIKASDFLNNEDFIENIMESIEYNEISVDFSAEDYEIDLDVKIVINSITKKEQQ